MDERGRVPSERRVELQVFGHRADPLFASHDEGNLHQMIVDH